DTSGWTEGSSSRSLSLGVQVRPKGGPKTAHVFRSLAIDAVVNFASQDGKPTSGGVENASNPNASSIFPRRILNSFSQASSRIFGRRTRLAGLAPRSATVSLKTSTSLTLLQPQ